MAMRRTLFSTIFVVACSLGQAAATLHAAPPGLLRIFGKDPAAVKKVGTKQLSEVDGPWMILAASFAGEEGKQKAQSLAEELSSVYGMPAFIHEEKFDFGGKLNTDSPDGRMARYANQAKYQAYAVLAGEYDSVDHPQLIKDLKRLKALKPKSLEGEVIDSNQEDNPLVAVRKLQQSLMKRTGKTDTSPLKNAFATTNPMLPEEFFSAPEVDSFVMELNSQVQFSLLENTGRYTVVVRTFSGLGAIVDGRQDKEFVPSSERMDNCAANADEMTQALRKEGVEAYQFHDRNRSLVTIGSFESLGQQSPGGKFQFTAEIRQIMQKYCAGGQAPPAEYKGSGVVANNIALIPFDVRPTPIAVPRKSKRSLFIGNKLGMR